MRDRQRGNRKLGLGEGIEGNCRLRVNADRSKVRKSATIGGILMDQSGASWDQGAQRERRWGGKRLAAVGVAGRSRDAMLCWKHGCPWLGGGGLGQVRTSGRGAVAIGRDRTLGVGSRLAPQLGNAPLLVWATARVDIDSQSAASSTLSLADSLGFVT